MRKTARNWLRIARLWRDYFRRQLFRYRVARLERKVKEGDR